MNNTAEVQAKPRKEEILDVATRLFAERGYEGTSMNDVAERVGMRKASLFYHFATKDALYEAVLDRWSRPRRRRSRRSTRAAARTPTGWTTVTETVVDVLASHPYAARLLLREAMDWGPVIRGKLLDRILLVLEAGGAWIRAGQEQGAFAEGDPKQVLLSAVGMHFVPFAIGQFVERYTGKAPFDAGFVAERRAAVKVQARNLHLRKS